MGASVVELTPGITVQWYDSDLIEFLAGPIQGAPDWQATARAFFVDNYRGENDLFLANPRRHLTDEDFVYGDQVGWEKKHIRRSAEHGGILVWLAKQDLDLPYREGRPYAQTTRHEWARAIGWKDFDPRVNLSIGIEPGYNGNERYYRHTAEDEFGLTVHDNLEDLCVESLGKLLKAERIRIGGAV